MAKLFMNDKDAKFPFNNRGEMNANPRAWDWESSSMTEGGNDDIPQARQDKENLAAAEVEAVKTGLSTDKEALKAKNLRSGIFKTSGGAAGDEILSGGVKKRANIFGNA